MELDLSLVKNYHHDEEVDDAFEEDGGELQTYNKDIITEYISEKTLVEATGCNDLSLVKFLELVVDMTDNSLGDLGDKLPNLLQVKFNGSIIPTIRDLGTSLRRIRVLWISRCGTQDLDGLGALPELRELYASYNDIDDIYPISDLDYIEIIDLEGNKVDDISQMHFLSSCTTLQTLTLEGNPVASLANYRTEIAAAIPHLQYLDDFPVTEEERKEGERAISTASSDSSASQPLEISAQHRELELLKHSIKYTKVEAEVNDLTKEPMIVSMSSSDISVEESSLMKNPQIIKRPSSALLFRRPSPESPAVRPMSARPHAQSNPLLSARSLRRPQSARPMSARSFRPGSARRILRPMSARSSFDDISRSSISSQSSNGTDYSDTLEGDDDDDIFDTSSTLTFGSKTLFVGNPVKRLLSRKAEEKERKKTTEDGSIDVDFTVSPFVDPVANVLDDIAAVKREQVNREYLDALEAEFTEFEDDVEVSEHSQSSEHVSDNAESIELDSIPILDDVFPSPAKSDSSDEMNNLVNAKERSGTTQKSSNTVQNGTSHTTCMQKSHVNIVRSRPRMASVSPSSAALRSRKGVDIAFTNAQHSTPVIQGRLRPSSRRGIEQLRQSRG